MPKIKLFEDFQSSKQLSLPLEISEADMSATGQILAYLTKIDTKVNTIGKSQPYQKFLTKKIYQQAFETYNQDGHKEETNVYWSFLNSYSPEYESELWKMEDLKELSPSLDTNELHNELTEFGSGREIEDYLTEEGLNVYKKFEQEHFEESIEENGLYYALSDVDENGNLSIYRSIIYHDDDESYFKTALQYKNLGIYWTFESNKAEPHWGYSNKASAIEVIYHAKVNMSSINWPMTLVVNAWTSKEEKEIRLNEGALVEVYAIQVDDEPLHNLKKSIIVKA